MAYERMSVGFEPLWSKAELARIQQKLNDHQDRAQEEKVLAETLEAALDQAIEHSCTHTREGGSIWAE